MPGHDFFLDHETYYFKYVFAVLSGTGWRQLSLYKYYLFPNLHFLKQEAGYAEVGENDLAPHYQEALKC
jgi:hypothetical protein